MSLSAFAIAVGAPNRIGTTWNLMNFVFAASARMPDPLRRSYAARLTSAAMSEGRS